MEANFASRLNILTGDNGLGKSFLLDIAWWALTRQWAGLPAKPRSDAKASEISFSFEGKSRTKPEVSVFARFKQEWSRKPGRPAMPGLVIYAQVDGGFSVWDPARNYWLGKKDDTNRSTRPAAYLFGAKDVWDGLREGEKYLCNGLIADWAGWQKENGEPYQQLCLVLKSLSESEGEPLSPGPLARTSLDDVRDIPTLRMPYGQDVPVIHASAGIRRALALAYLLVWTWQEHRRASAILDQETTPRVIFLVDEIECHLHPKWQRVVLRSLLGATSALLNRSEVEVQVIAATHSPMILSSLEPMFDPGKDKLFDLDLRDGAVEFREVEWRKRGDAEGWLQSELFDLKSSRPPDVERLLEEASHVGEDRELYLKLDGQLRSALPEMDRFWITWRYKGEKRGWVK
jgi:hypothetical protein